MLLQRVSPHYNRTIRTVIRTVTVEKAVLSSLWALANPDSYREISDRFGLSKSKFSDTFHCIIRIISNTMSDLIVWPRGNYVLVGPRHSVRMDIMSLCPQTA